LTRQTYIALAAFGSAALLLGAYGFQHLGGLLPCKMCLWQRWPHAAAVVIGLLLWAGGPRALAWLGALSAATTAGIGAFHAGVEWKWWDGPASCSGGGNSLSGLSGADLLSTTAPVDLVMCDDIAWQMLGLSMAGWNAVASLALALLWVAAATKRA